MNLCNRYFEFSFIFDFCNEFNLEIPETPTFVEWDELVNLR